MSRLLQPKKTEKAFLSQQNRVFFSLIRSVFPVSSAENGLRMPHAQVTLPFFSRITTDFKNSTPLLSPSAGDIRLSSCSIESVPS